MTYFVPQGDIRIDAVHSLALRKAIGERFQVSLDQRRIAMPPHLLSLVKQMRLSEMPIDTQ
jgi:hypothetical protein